MKPKQLFPIIAALALLLAVAPWSSSQDSVAPGADGQPSNSAGDAASKKGGAGVSIMTAEQGEALQEKVDKLLEDQKKLLEKIEQMQKDIEFIKAASRTR
jgi:hypothetical protein